MEAALSRGEKIDIDLLARISSHIRRMSETIGLERKPRTIDNSHNILVDYFAKPPTPKKGDADA